MYHQYLNVWQIVNLNFLSVGVEITQQYGPVCSLSLLGHLRTHKYEKISLKKDYNQYCWSIKFVGRNVDKTLLANFTCRKIKVFASFNLIRKQGLLQVWMYTSLKILLNLLISLISFFVATSLLSGNILNQVNSFR